MSSRGAPSARRRAWRRWLALGVLGSLGCGSAPERTSGIEGVEARIVVDRSEAYVGDPVGITVEVDVPTGYAVQEPLPARVAEFVTEDLEPAAPLETPWGSRYAWRWTVRPRVPGPQSLPELALPLSSAHGDDSPIRLGRLPLRVRSVREELPEQEALFDIRAAPTPSPWPARLFGLAGLMLLSGAFYGVVRARRARRGIDLCELARQSLTGLRDLPDQSPRDRAGRSIELVRHYVAARWQIESPGCVASELPERVDGPLRELLGHLEGLRFGRAPAAEHLDRCLRELEEYWEHAVRA